MAYDLFWYEEAGDPLDFALQAELGKSYANPMATGGAFPALQGAEDARRVRTITYLIGNGIATIAVARWDEALGWPVCRRIFDYGAAGQPALLRSTWAVIDSAAGLGLPTYST